MSKLNEIYCNCNKITSKRGRWIANVSKDAYVQTQCPSCKQCVTIEKGEFKNSIPMSFAFSKKR